MERFFVHPHLAASIAEFSDLYTLLQLASASSRLKTALESNQAIWYHVHARKNLIPQLRGRTPSRDTLITLGMLNHRWRRLRHARAAVVSLGRKRCIADRDFRMAERMLLARRQGKQKKFDQLLREFNAADVHNDDAHLVPHIRLPELDREIVKLAPLLPAHTSHWVAEPFTLPPLFTTTSTLTGQMLTGRQMSVQDEGDCRAMVSVFLRDPTESPPRLFAVAGETVAFGRIRLAVVRIFDMDEECPAKCVAALAIANPQSLTPPEIILWERRPVPGAIRVLTHTAEGRPVELSGIARQENELTVPFDLDPHAVRELLNKTKDPSVVERLIALILSDGVTFAQVQCLLPVGRLVFPYPLDFTGERDLPTPLGRVYDLPLLQRDEQFAMFNLELPALPHEPLTPVEIVELYLRMNSSLFRVLLDTEKKLGWGKMVYVEGAESVILLDRYIVDLQQLMRAAEVTPPPFTRKHIEFWSSRGPSLNLETARRGTACGIATLVRARDRSKKTAGGGGSQADVEEHARRVMCPEALEPIADGAAWLESGQLHLLAFERAGEAPGAEPRLFVREYACVPCEGGVSLQTDAGRLMLLQQSRPVTTTASSENAEAPSPLARSCVYTLLNSAGTELCTFDQSTLMILQPLYLLDWMKNRYLVPSLDVIS